MKKISKILTLALSGILLLTGCNNTTSSSELPPSVEESEIDYEGEKWSKELQKAMVDTLTEVIPYVEMKKIVYENNVTSQGDPVLVIYENGVDEEGLTETYKAKLEQTRYKFEKTDDNGGKPFHTFNKELSDGSTIKLWFGYYIGTTTTGEDRGFEIDATYIKKLEYTTSWTEKESRLLESQLHEVIPCPRLSNRHLVVHEVMPEYGADFIHINDPIMVSEDVEAYIDLLLSEGYEAVGDDTGFCTYDKVSSYDDLYSVSIDVYDLNKLVGAGRGAEIFAKLKKNVYESKVWPKAQIDEYFENDPDIALVPEYNEALKYTYYHSGNAFTVSAACDSSKFIDYIETLCLAGYRVQYDSAYATYYLFNFNEHVGIALKYSDKIKNVKIQINKMEEKHYNDIQITSTFPTNLLKQYVSSTTNIPSFAADQYKAFHIEKSTSDYIRIDAIDIDNNIDNEYKVILENAGYTVVKNTNDVYQATSSNNEVLIVFYSSNHYFTSSFSKNI